MQMIFAIKHIWDKGFNPKSNLFSEYMHQQVNYKKYISFVRIQYSFFIRKNPVPLIKIPKNP